MSDEEYYRAKFVLKAVVYCICISTFQNISEGPENEKEKQRLEIQTLYAYDLFHNKQYQESMKQFLELDTGIYV
jgi:hypothetical protein